MEIPELVIKGCFDPNSGSFGGLLTSPKVGLICPITGKMPIEFFQKEQPPTNKGRHKETSKHIAALMHVLAAKGMGNIGLDKSRLIAAKALAIGDENCPDNVIRQMQVKEKKAETALNGDVMGGDFLLYTDVMVIFDKIVNPKVEKGQNWVLEMHADGKGWYCKWGEKEARYGRVTLKYVVDSDQDDSSPL